MHGYQLLVELDSMFGDAYEPSTGTVYPATTALEEEGLISSERDGRRTTYALTDTGRAVLAARLEQLAQLELRTGAHIVANGALPGAVDKFAALAKSLAGEVGADAVVQVIYRASAELVQLVDRKGSK
jgi:DNA-binding transcriptional ArsR family regulator